MADQITAVDKANQLAIDPDFLKLAPEEQKHLMGKVLSLVPSSQTTAHGVTHGTPITRDNADTVIDFLRPIISGGVGAGVGSISGPFAPATGPAAYIGTDTLLQKLKGKQDSGFVSKRLGMDPESTASQLTNSVENLGVGKIGEGVVKGGMKLVKGFNSSNIPESLSILKPTTGQALPEGSMLQRLSRYIEDNFAKGSKAKAQQRSANLAGKEAENLGYKLGNSYIRSELRNPVDMFNVIANDIPPEEYYTKIKIKPETADYTPVRRFKTTEEIPFKTPVKLELDKTKSPPRYSVTPGETQSIQQETVNTMPTGPVTQAKTGSNITIPGETVEKKFAENYSQLDAIIEDPKKLQAMLTRQQSTGSVNQNLKSDLKSYKFMRSWQDATSVDPANPSNIKIDAQKLRDSFFGTSEESLTTIYNAQNRADIEQFIKNVAKTQEKGQTSRLFRLAHGGAVIPFSLLSGHLGASGIATGVYLGANVIGRLLTNPKTARLMVNIAGGQPLNMSEQWAAKLITSTLQGAAIGLENRDGSISSGVIEGGEVKIKN